jgi:hypothetical protein
LPNQPPIIHDYNDEDIHGKERPAVEVDNTAQPLPQEIEEGNIEYKVTISYSYL